MNDYEVTEVPLPNTTPTDSVGARRPRSRSRLAIAGGSLLLVGGLLAGAVVGPAALAAIGRSDAGSGLIQLAVSTGTEGDATGGSGPGWGHHGRGGPGDRGLGAGRLDVLATAATALGMTEDDLKAELSSGKSIADVAATKKVATTKIVDAIVSSAKTQLATAVSDGRITQAQADAMSATLATRATELVNGTFPGRPDGDGRGRGGFGRGGHGGRGGHDGFEPGGRGGRLGIDRSDDLAVAASALGVTEAELRTSLESGKTIADVATTEKVALTKVIDALVADTKAELAAAVTAGTITKAQADAAGETLADRVTDFVNRTHLHAGDCPNDPDASSGTASGTSS